MFKGDDRLRGRLIEALMCDFRIDAREIVEAFDISPEALLSMFQRVDNAFDQLLDVSEEGLFIPQRARPLTRIIARQYGDQSDGHQLPADGPRRHGQ